MFDDTDDLLTTTFPSQQEADRAVRALNALDVQYERIDPTPPLTRVALPAIVVDRETRVRLLERDPDVLVSGWIDYRRPTGCMPVGSAPDAPGECFKSASIVVLQPCFADEAKIRLTAHVRGDLGPVFPYLNAVMQTASFIPAAEALSFMDRHRMVALYRRRVTIAKADDVVDAWLVLDRIRVLVEETWANRQNIEPSHEARKKPPALEIFKRLPGTNCRQCGELTCMAFALRLRAGAARLRQCRPVFLPQEEGRRMALVDICSALGVDGDSADGGEA